MKLPDRAIIEARIQQLDSQLDSLHSSGEWWPDLGERWLAARTALAWAIGESEWPPGLSSAPMIERRLAQIQSSTTI